MTPDRIETDSLDVIFVGRANIDLTVRIPFRPAAGRTAFASELMVTAGGKSLNQAIAVSRFGGRAALVANAGADHWGDQLMRDLTEAGVDTTCFRLLPGARTGAAIIEVTPDGENFLVLALSPAAELSLSDVGQALTRINAPVVVVQLDLPPEPLSRVLAEGRPSTVIGNLVPHPAFDRRLLSRCDVLVVNQQEAEVMLAVAEVDPLDAARQLQPPFRLSTRQALGTRFSAALLWTFPEVFLWVTRLLGLCALAPKPFSTRERNCQPRPAE